MSAETRNLVYFVAAASHDTRRDGAAGYSQVPQDGGAIGCGTGQQAIPQMPHPIGGKEYPGPTPFGELSMFVFNDIVACIKLPFIFDNIVALMCSLLFLNGLATLSSNTVTYPAGLHSSVSRWASPPMGSS